jgi:hypothetical protein
MTRPKPGQHLKSIVKPSATDKAKAAFDAVAIPAGDLLEATEVELAEEDDAPEMFRTFTDQAVAPIGVATADKRMFATDIDLTFRSMPLPMQWCEQSSGGHSNSYTVGVIEAMRVEGDLVLASGYMLNTSHADDAMELVGHGVSNPSVDLANAEYVYTDKDGNELEWEDLWDLMDEGGEYFMTFTKAEVIATTLVSTPAFDTRFTLDTERASREVAIVASVVEQIDSLFASYDPALFGNPNLLRPTRPTMDKETGRIFGHLAEFGQTYRGGNGERVPRNFNDYANFHTSQVLLDDGKQLAVGRLTVQGGHASTDCGVSAATARAHYDNAALAFGLVRVGEDRHGIWFSGVPAPGVDPDLFQQGMTAPLSGDWRDCGQGLDMIAAHAVNSPGFPIMSGSTGPDGREVALVAAFGPRPDKKTSGGFTMDRESLKTLLTEVVETLDERKAQRAKDRADAKSRDEALARAAKLSGGYPGHIAGDKDQTKAKPGPSQAGPGQPSGGGSYPGKISAAKTTAPKGSVKTAAKVTPLAAALARAAQVIGK